MLISEKLKNIILQYICILIRHFVLSFIHMSLCIIFFILGSHMFVPDDVNAFRWFLTSLFF